jgi:hypothetical protein
MPLTNRNLGTDQRNKVLGQMGFEQIRSLRQTGNPVIVLAREARAGEQLAIAGRAFAVDTIKGTHAYLHGLPGPLSRNEFYNIFGQPEPGSPSGLGFFATTWLPASSAPDQI